MTEPRRGHSGVVRGVDTFDSDEVESLSSQLSHLSLRSDTCNVPQTVKTGDYPCDQVKTGDYPRDQVKTGDYPCDNVKTGDYPRDQVKTGNYPHDQLKTGDHPHDQLETGDYPQDLVKTGDHPPDQLETGDYQLDQVKTGDHPRDQLETGDYPLDQVKTGDYPLDHMKTGGYPRDQVKTGPQDHVKSQVNHQRDTGAGVQVCHDTDTGGDRPTEGGEDMAAIEDMACNMKFKVTGLSAKATKKDVLNCLGEVMSDPVMVLSLFLPVKGHAEIVVKSHSFDVDWQDIEDKVAGAVTKYSIGKIRLHPLTEMTCVTWVSENVNKEMLELYASNPKRTLMEGHCDPVIVSWNQKTKKAFVQFIGASAVDISRLCGSSHTLDQMAVCFSPWFGSEQELASQDETSMTGVARSKITTERVLKTDGKDEETRSGEEYFTEWSREISEEELASYRLIQKEQNFLSENIVIDLNKRSVLICGTPKEVNAAKEVLQGQVYYIASLGQYTPLSPAVITVLKQSGGESFLEKILEDEDIIATVHLSTSSLEVFVATDKTEAEWAITHILYRKLAEDSVSLPAYPGSKVEEDIKLVCDQRNVAAEFHHSRGHQCLIVLRGFRYDVRDAIRKLCIDFAQAQENVYFDKVTGSELYSNLTNPVEKKPSTRQQEVESTKTFQTATLKKPVQESQSDSSRTVSQPFAYRSEGQVPRSEGHSLLDKNEEKAFEGHMPKPGHRLLWSRNKARSQIQRSEGQKSQLEGQLPKVQGQRSRREDQFNRHSSAQEVKCRTESRISPAECSGGHGYDSEVSGSQITASTIRPQNEVSTLSHHEVSKYPETDKQLNKTAASKFAPGQTKYRADAEEEEMSTTQESLASSAIVYVERYLPEELKKLKDDLKKIASQVRLDNVLKEIQFKHPSSETPAVSELKEKFLKKMATASLRMDAGMFEFLTSNPEGKQKLDLLMKTCECAIEVGRLRVSPTTERPEDDPYGAGGGTQGDQENTPRQKAGKSGQKPTGKVRKSIRILKRKVRHGKKNEEYLFGKLRVCLQSGDITKSEATVLVNVVNSNVDVHTGLCKAFCKAAGFSLERALKSKTPCNPGDILTTRAFKISNTAFIYHAVMATSHEAGRENIIPRVIMEVLHTANAFSSQSVAFPALGCGGCKVPAEVVAEHFINCLCEFVSDKDSQVKEVMLYVNQKDTFKVFKECFDSSAEGVDSVCGSGGAERKEGEKAGVVSDKRRTHPPSDGAICDITCASRTMISNIKTRLKDIEDRQRQLWKKNNK